MKRLIALFVLAAVALTPGVAQAKSKSKVYRGTFQYVGADGDYVTGSFGKVQLVDGKRNDKLSVHVRRLAKHARYVFRLQQAPAKACEATAPGGTDVPGWTYRRGGVLKTSRKGVANSWARSRTFTPQSGVKYFVGVFLATPTGGPGELVLCAALNTKSKKPKSHGKKDDARGNAQGQKDDDGKKDNSSPGNAQGQDDDKNRGKSDEPHGKSDQEHGKSDQEHGKSDQEHGKSKDKGRGKPRD